jgi:YcxB-like protein
MASTHDSETETYQVAEFIFALFFVLLVFSEICRLPDEIVLKSRRRIPLLGLIFCLLFTAIGLMMMIDGESFGVIGTFFFALGDVVFFVMLLPNAAYLRLGREGFVLGNFNQETFCRWQDVKGIRVDRFAGVKNGWAALPFFVLGIFVNGVGIPRGLKRVVFDFSRPTEPHETGRKFMRSVFGYDGGLSETYGMKAKKLARLMNRFKSRFEIRQQSKSQPTKRASLSATYFTVDFNLKESDLQHANFWFRFQTRASRVLNVLWPLLGIAVLILGYVTQSDTLVSVSIVVALTILPVLNAAIIWFQTKRRFRLLQEHQKKLHFAFTTDGYRVEDLKTSGDISWDTVLRAVESKHSFNLFFHPAVFHTIPKRCFANSQDMARLRTLLSQALGSKAVVQSKVS